jgi:hydroxypyruvate isomerase
MGKHYIYEIFGRKIGATNDVERRMKEQKVKEGEYRIIEEHTNAKTCSIREIELQKEFNYPVDRIQYWKTLRNQKKAMANIDCEARNKKINHKVILSNVDWEARNAKVDKEAKSKKLKKPINQYDLNGNFIKRWDSATDISKKLGLNNSNIAQCCKEKLKTAHKHIWKYAG